ncbi:MAG: prolipoprotein diacylglyceryl transferase [Treponema sp.]|nr:prolipoprotein diacylglyceryl transferase [Treponema sp.]
MLRAVNFPWWLKPEIIPGLPFRWYSVMYIVAFTIAYFLYRRQIRERRFPMTDDDLTSLFFWGIIGLLLGARVFATLVYETSDIYRRRPWLVFSPFRDGKFTGFMGMSYHGGVIGGALGTFVWCVVKRRDPREIADMFVASIPLGYTFGRLGNFINGELYGRITGGPLGMIFPDGFVAMQDKYWNEVAAAAAAMGIPPSHGIVNPPRHPSQLYEALFEGVILWLIIWFFRNRKPFKGFLVSLYLAGYGLFRFFIEYFREPDADLGYRIEFIKSNAVPALSHPPLSFSTGQILSFGMVVLGIVWLVAASRLPDREPVRLYPAAGESADANFAARTAAASKEENAERNRRRKLRKKLR